MTLQGINYKTIPLISSSMELVIKILASFVFVPLWGYAGASVAEPFSWLLCMLFLAVFLHTDYEKREDLFLKNTGARFVLNLPPAIFYLTIKYILHAAITCEIFLFLLILCCCLFVHHICIFRPSVAAMGKRI